MHGYVRENSGFLGGQMTPPDRLIRTKEETIRLLQEQMRDNVRRIIKLRGEIKELKNETFTRLAGGYYGAL